MTNLDVPVNAIAQDKEGKMWLGTNTGLLCYDNNVPQNNSLTDYCKKTPYTPY